eukprot:6478406-Amphidinium_carterae.1
MINGHTSEETMSQLQQPRLKASTRAVPSTMPKLDQTIPRPTATANPVSPPDNHPTSSASPTDSDDAAAAAAAAASTGNNTADVTMRAESISSRSSSATVSSETMVNIEQLIWNNLVTNERAHMVRYQWIPLGRCRLLPNRQSDSDSSRIRDSWQHQVNREGQLHPSTMGQQSAEAQMEHFVHNGTVPGFKEVRGDNVHRRHRFHNRPDQCLNFAIHCRWNSRDRTMYGRDKPITLMVWRQ